MCEGVDHALIKGVLKLTDTREVRRRSHGRDDDDDYEDCDGVLKLTDTREVRKQKRYSKRGCATANTTTTTTTPTTSKEAPL